MHETGDPPAKRARTQIKTVIREKSKTKTSKSSSKKSAKPKKAPKPKKQKAESSIAPSERRRSGRAHVVSDYTERDDEADEEEMLEGVAEWDYGEDNSDEEESGSGEEGSEQSDDAESANEDEDEEDDEEAPSTRRNGSKGASSPKAKSSVKASVLAKLDRTSRTRTRGGRAPKDDFEMDVDE